ncbi:DNA polymerase III subunit beta [Acetobacter orleanensis]|uniref:Beta sliding clamp n=1 Tax=Acetobacter orleanensis TaxID=104099 RepID=A0A4Y3TKV4_9PROT|nr:DNA polymerase III subunit beta [Acetobacter orleanensis]KXV63123.1 DNA polymerase III subunit beta [Acetobacter orleanensis]PCD80251.1 DNA polymerase III subunit beta [Acetobacter orleanensis]GAN69012.1 DNA polymerase III subunit beta [Acetobacter orleanensis JCM 7639]GBR30422.1 DNA polymerase III subunit beta [Acetobacter orleanensis NRIC 0473]GEB81580.1 DNA polymerase III subunit beta [Acetobacter orleanensis]
MKFSAERAILLKALAHIQSVAEKRNTIPILANVLIQAANGRLSLKATDMEIEVVEDIPATITRDGATTVPASVLYEIVRKLPDSVEVELDQADSEGPLLLRADRYATRLNVLSVDDFPSMGTGDLPCHFKLGSAVLRSLIDRTRFAISTEETRYYLNGIFFHAADTDSGKQLRAVATDGHRLARVEAALPAGAETMPGVIIPRKTVAELRKLLDEAPEEIEVALSETRVQFTTGSVMLTSKLIDGTFPEYDRVIPLNNTRILRVGKKDFSDAVARVAAISQERSRPVKMALEPGLLTLSASSPEQGMATEELDKSRISYDAEALEIGFQARYLNDITDQVEKDVEFAFSDNSAPTIVRDVDSPSALYVLMPMRV